MNLRWLVATFFVSTASLSVATLEAGARCTPRPVPPTLDDLNQLLECKPSSRVLLVPWLWRPIYVQITCPKRMFKIFTGNDANQLQQKLREREMTWCVPDWKSFDGFGSRVCHLQLSPFKTTLVGVTGSKGCQVDSIEQFSVSMVACGALGLLLFYSAGFLSSNFLFRMSCGTAFFSATFLALFAIVLLRSVPYKRAMATTLAVTGSTGLATIRWLTGHWLPSWQQLISNPYFAAYVLFTVLLGAVITYIYDDMSNPRINTVIKVTIRVIALALIYYSTWTSWPVASCVMGLMVSALVGPDVVRGVHETGVRVQQVVHTTRELLTPLTVRRRPRVVAQTTAEATMPTRDTATPMPVSMDTASLVEHTDSDVNVSLGVRDVSGLRIMRHKPPPPSPWDVTRTRLVKTFEEQMHKSLLKQAGRRGRPSTREMTSAPKGSQNSAPRSHGRASEIMTQSGAPSQSHEGSAGISEVVQQGFILNPNSGRLIKVGGDTYNHLLAAGYTPDTARGKMVVPAHGLGAVSPPPRLSGSRTRTSSRLT